MNVFLSHLIILSYCLGGIYFQGFSKQTIVSFLLSVTAAAFFYYFQDKKLSRAALSFYAAAIPFFPGFFLFIPLFTIEASRIRFYLVILVFFAENFLSFAQSDIPFFLFLLFGTILALFLEYLTKSYNILAEKYKHMRDDSTERNLLLKARNQTLLENQDYEIHNATLQERNRIAREIHDNVGHMLSRSILMTGALQAINQDDNCSEPLQLLQDTLSQAMDNIRASVHNLHDDSINLQKSIENLIRNFTFCPAHLEYDIQNDVPSTVRYAFISIIKEALTNISKHSNATLVNITLREHPSMYQLIIHDNGKTASTKTFSLDNIEEESNGIGLVNIADRVRLLKGILQISQKNGFQIFVSIPVHLN
ncbi:two-component sensor histidine kinase [bacterium D16-51]|nr:two-component sensor histidine kinase [bacterium D16-59]RKI59006.1 two-component sensor histidine kinase [bacterium D16-51]